MAAEAFITPFSAEHYFCSVSSVDRRSSGRILIRRVCSRLSAASSTI